MTFRDLFELEAVVDNGAGGDGGTGDTGSAGDGGTGDGGGAAAADAGAAAAAVLEGSGDVAPPSPGFNFDEWAATDEGQSRLGSAFEGWATQRAEASAAAEAAARAAEENPFGDIEEGLGLLGIDPARFREYLGVQNAPLAAVAEKVQAQEAIQWVDGQLTELGQAKPDLLGDGVGKLADLVDSDGNPLFSPDEVLQANRNAVLQAASAIETVARQTGQQVSSADALKQAAEAVSGRDALIGKIAVERHIRQLEGVGSAAADISGSGASGAETRTGIEGGDELAVARRYAREHNLTR